jgi:hypothetical protein
MKDVGSSSRARGLPGPRHRVATHESEAKMESKSENQLPLDAFTGEASSGSANRRLRTSLETVFLDAGLRFADAPSDEQLDLRAPLRQVCTEARRSGLRAEQLLVIIKDVWSGLPAGIAHVPSVHGDARLNYVISTCVDEYYGHIAGDFEAAP